MRVGIDFGLTNVDVVATHGADVGAIAQFATLPSQRQVDLAQVQRALDAIGRSMADCEQICVTGGQHRRLPDAIDGTPIVKVGEIEAIGLGGLRLAQRTQPDLREALVVSAGSGTAMIAVRDGCAQHVTGSAVGGGTLVGLCKLLIGTSDPQQIDALALAGDSNKVDITLIEATGGAIGRLPADANAVNFGRAATLEWRDVAREDMAAGVAVMVGQVIAVIAINAARAERLDHIVVIGHLVDLACVRKVLNTVGGYYGVDFTVPEMPGYATAIGALVAGAEQSTKKATPM
ncbi:MAG: Fumble domain-containing protein [Anaerolineae bacterium]|nr:Fumble domain-containing protein [Candidatus Roseilinea sp.]MDW8352613.1 Fumble domain-containing protein [Anaerolineae bacterium]MDW8448362.1 Fumble domain-containing protein [Anaerolineae bacterium]